MKALSLIEPWASLVVLGQKRFETRSWKTAHRGPLLIHAAAKMSHLHLCYTEPFKTALAPVLKPYEPTKGEFPWDLPLGAIVGLVEVIDCHKAEDVRTWGAENLGAHARELSFGDYSPGRWAWELRLIERFPQPIPIRGALGLWDVPEEILPAGLQSVPAGSLFPVTGSGPYAEGR